MNICGGGLHPIDEIHFISSILGKFHQDPSLVNLFLSEAGRRDNKPVSLQYGSHPTNAANRVWVLRLSVMI